MIWTSLLLSISGYCWYLVIASGNSTVYSAAVTGYRGLLLICILPTILGYLFNFLFLSIRPTVLKILLFNGLSFICLAGLSIWGCRLVWFYSHFPFIKVLAPGAGLLFAFGGLFSWICGTYFALIFLTSKAGKCPSVLRIFEGCLLSMITAAYLLTVMGVSTPLLMGIIIGWFLFLALSLALEGNSSTGDPLFRYDLILIHAIVPVVSAFLFLFLVFTREVRLLLLGGQKALLAVMKFIFNLLNLLFSQTPQYAPVNPKPSPAHYPIMEKTGKILVLPTWILIPIILVGLVLFIILLIEFIRWLNSRWGPVQAGSNRSLFSKNIFGLIWHDLILLPGLLWKGLRVLSRWISTASQKFYGKWKIYVRQWLPARSPVEKIVRTYQAFLRWGFRRGCRRRPSETPLEYLGRLQVTKKPFPEKEISRLTSLFLEARYNNRRLDWAEALESEKLLKKIKSTRQWLV